MALIGNYKTDLVLGLHDKIVTMSMKTGVSTSFLISMEATFSGKKFESDGEEDKSDQNKIEVIDVNNLAISGDLLAVTTTEKSLFLFNLSLGTENFVSRKRINRIATSLKFSPDGANIIVTDRTGDVYIFSCTDQENGKWLYGHMSQTLDISFSADQKYIITCDRDEKIRVTNYPQTHEIETFCLGHQEFVSAIDFLALYCLVSVSGDQTVRFWDYIKGKELHKIDLSKPGTSLTTKQLKENVFLIAVSLYDPPISANIVVFKVELLADNIFKSTLIHEQIFDELNLTSMLFHSEDYLILSFVTSSSKMALKVLKYSDDKFIEHTSETMVNIQDKLANEIFRDKRIDFVDHVVKLYKKKFDNITKYQERKKRRIEQQSK